MRSRGVISQRDGCVNGCNKCLLCFQIRSLDVHGGLEREGGGRWFTYVELSYIV